jgi:hypothetical protein
MQRWAVVNDIFKVHSIQLYNVMRKIIDFDNKRLLTENGVELVYCKKGIRVPATLNISLQP